MLAVIAVLLLLLPPAMPFEASACDGSTYAPNSSFQANLNLVAAALHSNASSMRTALAGTTPNRAYAMALCRGDVNASTCSACVAAAFRGAQEKCPLDTGVTMYGESCLVRYSRVQFLDTLRPDQWQPGEWIFRIFFASETVTTAPATWFSAAATAVLAAVVDHAVASRKYFATAEVGFEPKIYALAQCFPGMTPSQCQGCLGTLLLQTPRLLVNATKPRRVVSFKECWCNLRYGVEPLYEGRSMLRLQAPPPPPKSGKKRSAAVAIACSLLVLVFVLSVVALVGFKRRRRAKATDALKKKKNIARVHCMVFDLPTLREATENFAQKNEIGKGGFGIVYKGILPDGQEIAVKKIPKGAPVHGLKQLQNEVELLAELQHKNLVILQGFCQHPDDTLLVYEYIRNGSLTNFLFEYKEQQYTLTWEQQYNIILGIAKGILYLHEDSGRQVIHRDLKPDNILLADDMDPKIADFGLARLLGEGYTNTVIGTHGYMAPELYRHGDVSPKIDMFSFGVLVLEIVTRRKSRTPADGFEGHLNSYVWNFWIEGAISEMIDLPLEEHARNQALRCINIGLLCVQPDPDKRPCISSVIFMLTRDDMEIPAPGKPAYYLGERAAPFSVAGDTITRLYPR